MREDTRAQRRCGLHSRLVQNLRGGRRVLAGDLQRAGYYFMSLVAAGVRVSHLGVSALLLHLQAAFLLGGGHLLAGQGASEQRR